MIGVAHVMGMNPILRSFFSGVPSLAWASALAAWSGKTSARAAAAAPAPTTLRKSRRSSKTACRTERSTRRSITASVFSGFASIGVSPPPFGVGARFGDESPDLSRARPVPRLGSKQINRFSEAGKISDAGLPTR